MENVQPPRRLLLPGVTRRTFESAAALGVFICGVAWWLFFRMTTGVTVDDALITFRYARNLALGDGFVYNAGERVLGTTTPLVTLFLALVGRLLGVDAIPPASIWLMMGFGVLTALVGYRLLSDIGFPLLPRLLFLAFFFGSSVILVSSVGGMETPFVLFCMISSLWAYVRRRPTACLCLCALLVLARIDGLVWVGVMMVALILQGGRLPWKGLAAFALLTLPWVVFAFVYFGSPLPNSIAAKRLIGQSVSLHPVLSRRGLNSFGLWILGSRKYDAATASALTLASVILLAFGARAYLDSIKGRATGMLLMIYGLAYALFLYLGRAPHFLWYISPLYLCLALLMAPGLWSLVHGMSSRLLKSPASLLEAALSFTLVAGFCLLRSSGVLARNLENQANDGMRREAGVWLRENTPAGSSVAMESIGYLAYYSDRRIIDLAGIVSPQILPLKRVSRSNAEFFSRVLTDLRPDYLVLRSFEYDDNEYFSGGRLFETAEQRQFFEDHYAEVRRFTARYPERWGRQAYLTVYARRGRTAPG